MSVALASFSKEICLWGIVHRYGVQKLVEGVDGADLLTLHEQGLLPLGEGDGLEEEEEDEEDEAPQLVELPGVGVRQGLGAEGGKEADGDGGGLEMEVEDDEEEEMEEEEDEDGTDDDGGAVKEAGQDVGGVEGKVTKRACRSKKSIRLASDLKGSGGSDAAEAAEEASTSKVCWDCGMMG